MVNVNSQETNPKEIKLDDAENKSRAHIDIAKLENEVVASNRDVENVADAQNANTDETISINWDWDTKPGWDYDWIELLLCFIFLFLVEDLCCDAEDEDNSDTDDCEIDMEKKGMY